MIYEAASGLRGEMTTTPKPLSRFIERLSMRSNRDKCWWLAYSRSRSTYLKEDEEEVLVAAETSNSNNSSM